MCGATQSGLSGTKISDLFEICFIIFICIDINICYPAGERAAGVGCFPVRSLA